MSSGSSSPQPNEHSISEAHSDPVGALVHAAVADRPLEEVVRLITLLEQSPQYARATVDALRAVGVDRSVEDVTRLVVLLTQPPRDPDSADEAIRAAAESRPVEDVTRLMALLHQSPLEPHVGQEAARAAATARPVEELVELIGRLSEERDARPVAAIPYTAPPGAPDGPYLVPEGLMVPPAPDAPPAVADGRAPRRIARGAARRTTHPVWPGLVSAAALLLCALLWFPLHRDGASLRAYGFALGLSALCAVLAVLLTLRPFVVLLALAVVVPAVLAGAQLYGGRFHSARLSQALDLTLAPNWAAGLVAVCAALVALTALVVRLAWQPPPIQLESRAMATASHPAD
ncbi:hypothetical protein ACIQI8_01925 [Streptomyces sp. NPDC092369]|uniref:hypothetical protein n=1 Tax=Streptomyces sp. NPDC092369 TaxID=3366015 RepID=UPI00380228AE